MINLNLNGVFVSSKLLSLWSEKTFWTQLNTQIKPNIRGKKSLLSTSMITLISFLMCRRAMRFF